MVRHTSELHVDMVVHVHTAVSTFQQRGESLITLVRWPSRQVPARLHHRRSGQVRRHLHPHTATGSLHHMTTLMNCRFWSMRSSGALPLATSWLFRLVMENQCIVGPMGADTHSWGSAQTCHRIADADI